MGLKRRWFFNSLQFLRHLKRSKRFRMDRLVTVSILVNRDHAMPTSALIDNSYFPRKAMFFKRLQMSGTAGSILHIFLALLRRGILLREPVIVTSAPDRIRKSFPIFGDVIHILPMNRGHLILCYPFNKKEQIASRIKI